MSYLLTFAIVTYNKSHVLHENLIRLIPIAEKYPMEILVCDNSSPDETQDICKQYCSKYNFFSYYRQESNVGYDRNVITAFRLAKAPYVWLHGESRSIDENNFSDLWKLIQNNVYDSISFHDDTRYDLQPIEISDLSNLIAVMGFRYSLLGSFIIKNPCNDEQLYSKYIGNLFVHIPFLFESLLQRENSRNIIVYNRYFKTIETGVIRKQFWKAHSFETFSKCWFYTILSLPNTISLDSKLICLKGLPKGHIFSAKNILKKHAMGLISKDDYRKGRDYLQFTSYTSPFTIDLILLIPRKILGITYNICHRLYKLAK